MKHLSARLDWKTPSEQMRARAATLSPQLSEVLLS
jgi:hypothetical protein